MISRCEAIIDCENRDCLDRQAAKHANEEREKYLQIYARTHERFMQFEQRQLRQMRRLLMMLSFEQYKALMGTFVSLFIVFVMLHRTFRERTSPVIIPVERITSRNCAIDQ